MKRRDVLKLLSAVAAPAALAPWLQGVAGPRSALAQQTGAIELGMNLAPVTYWSTEHPFRNLALSASRWRLQGINEPFSWDLPLPPATPDGYPTVIPAGTFLESFFLFTPHRDHLPDDLHVVYEGRGHLDYLAGGELLSRQPGHDVIRISRNDAPVIARLTSTAAGDPLRNVRISEGAEPPRETFRAEFLERLSRMSVLRFMDWMDTNNSQVSRWDERPSRSRYSQSENGVALELMVELCNTLKVAPWFTLPHLADDDYVERFAAEVRATLDPSLPVYVEHSNEVWNALFEQSRHAQREGLRLGLSTYEYEAGLRYYSQRATHVISLWEDVFGEECERVQGVYAAQAVTPWTSEVILSWGDAAKHADILAVAPYFGGGLAGPDRGPEVSNWTLDRLFEELDSEVDGHNREFIRAQAAMAERFGVKLAAYEGGQHLVGHGGMAYAQRLEDLFSAANRDPRMGDLYRKHLGHWAQAGGGTYALYNSMGMSSQWGSWGLLEYEAQKSSAKWQAIEDLLGV